MTDQTPESGDSELFEIDESRVEPEATTNIVDEHDDVEIDEDQEPVGKPGEYDDGEGPYDGVQAATEAGIGPFQNGGLLS